MQSNWMISKFKTLFTGNENGHGVLNVDKLYKSKKGKMEPGKGGIYTNTKRGARDEDYQYHLGGKVGLGISPLTKDLTCHFASVDVDTYDPAKTDYILDVIYNYRLPIFPFRTKSNGLHLHIFFKEPEKAKDVRSRLYTLRNLLGLTRKTELFPKQSILDNKEKDIGNWINLPYYGSDKSEKYLIDAQRGKCTLSHAINVMMDGRITLKELDTALKELPLSDGPPCLQTMYVTRTVPEARNNYLFMMGVYFMSKDGEDDLHDQLLEVNSKMDHSEGPLPEREVKAISDSHKKNRYGYRCSQPPCDDFCDKKGCRLRKYGIGSQEVPGLEDPGQIFIRQGIGEPSYIWKFTNGASLYFETPAEIMKQDIFRSKYLGVQKTLPDKLKEILWTDFVNRAFANYEEEQIIPEEDLSPEASVLRAFVEYLTESSQSTQIYIVTQGLAFCDRKEGMYYFKLGAFQNYVLMRREVVFKRNQLGNLLKRYGVTSTTKRIKSPFSGESKTVRVHRAVLTDELKRFVAIERMTEDEDNVQNEENF